VACADGNAADARPLICSEDRPQDYVDAAQQIETASRAVDVARSDVFAVHDRVSLAAHDQ